MSGIFFMRDASGSTNFKTIIYRILVILMLTEKSSLYVTGPKTFEILKGPSLVKSNLLLGLTI